MTSDGWTTVVVGVRPTEVEQASEVLWGHGAAAIEERARPDGLVELRAGYPTGALAEPAADAVGTAGYGPVTVEAVVDDGADAWREFAAPVRAGSWWIVPSWVRPPTVAEADRVVVIDPGRTFGSGSHPTTRLVLARLDRLLGPRCSVLDVGTGSGVLAVAAAMLGAARVVAVDIDPGSPGAVLDNAARNRVLGRIDASCRPLAEVATAQDRFDVVLANLLAPTIAELADDLVAAVAPNGVVVLSGLLADRWERSAARLAPLVVEDVREEDGWVAVTLRRPVTTT